MEYFDAINENQNNSAMFAAEMSNRLGLVQNELELENLKSSLHIQIENISSSMSFSLLEDSDIQTNLTHLSSRHFARYT